MTVENTPKKYDMNDRGQSSCQYYVAFCTKFNRRVFADGYEDILNEAIKDTGKSGGFGILDLIIEPDTVHCIVECPPDMSIQKCINCIKTYTAKKLHGQCPELKTRMPQMWTKKSFISSMGDVAFNSVCEYINNQRKG